MAERKRNSTKNRKLTPEQRKTDVTLRGVTAGSRIRIEEPPKTRKKRASKKNVVDIVGQADDAVLDQVGGFANFLRDYGVVGLAIGFIAGQQANGVVKQMVASFVDPLAKVWFGTDLSHRTLTLHHRNQPVVFQWGQFVYLVIELLLVLLFVYLVVKLFKLDKLKKVDDPKK